MLFEYEYLSESNIILHCYSWHLAIPATSTIEAPACSDCLLFPSYDCLTADSLSSSLWSCRALARPVEKQKPLCALCVAAPPPCSVQDVRMFGSAVPPTALSTTGLTSPLVSPGGLRPCQARAG